MPLSGPELRPSNKPDLAWPDTLITHGHVAHLGYELALSIQVAQVTEFTSKEY
jgi:hypothetical protein